MSSFHQENHCSDAGYKQTEVGVIPEDWSIRSLGEVVTFLDSQRRPVKDSDRAKIQGSIPYYGASGIVDYVNNYLFDEELILLGEDGENILSRNCRLAFRISGKVWVNNHAHVLRPNPGISIGFLTDYLESLNYERFNSGTAQPKLTQETCSDIPVALPPTLAEQEAIASALSDADALIEALEQLIAKKRQVKQGAMQELLTGKRRLPGFETKPGYKQTEVGAIPEDWVIMTLGEAANKFINGGTPSTHHDAYWKGDIPWITGADILNQQISEIRRFITKEAVNNSSTNIVNKGNLLLVSRTGVGKLAIAPCDIAISQDFTGIYTRDERLSTEYLFRFLDLNQSILTSQNQGTSILGITRETLSALTIFFPPTLVEQAAIAILLSDMDAEIAALEEKLVKARQVKQGMMQELLTGRIRLI